MTDLLVLTGLSIKTHSRCWSWFDQFSKFDAQPQEAILGAVGENGGMTEEDYSVFWKARGKLRQAFDAGENGIDPSLHRPRILNGWSETGFPSLPAEFATLWKMSKEEGVGPYQRLVFLHGQGEDASTKAAQMLKAMAELIREEKEVTLWESEGTGSVEPWLPDRGDFDFGRLWDAVKQHSSDAGFHLVLSGGFKHLLIGVGRGMGGSHVFFYLHERHDVLVRGNDQGVRLLRSQYNGAL